MAVSYCTELSCADQTVLIKMVRQVLKAGVIKKSLRLPDAPLSPALLALRACFVTIYRDQQLRGCIGTYTAEESLWLNVCRYTYYSCCKDRRFTPISKNELPSLRFEISILSELTPIKNTGEATLLAALEVGVDGVLLKDRYRSAIFLPSVWQQLTTPVQFLHALKQKGGWDVDYWSEDIEVSLFSTFVIEGRNNIHSA